VGKNEADTSQAIPTIFHNVYFAEHTSAAEAEVSIGGERRTEVLLHPVVGYGKQKK